MTYQLSYPLGAAPIDPYAASTPVTSAKTFKELARAVLLPAASAGPFVLMNGRVGAPVKLIASYATQAAAMAVLERDAARLSGDGYLGVFERAVAAPSGWAEVKTVKLSGGRPLDVRILAGAALGTLALVYLAARGLTKRGARGRRSRR